MDPLPDAVDLLRNLNTPSPTPPEVKEEEPEDPQAYAQAQASNAPSQPESEAASEEPMEENGVEREPEMLNDSEEGLYGMQQIEDDLSAKRIRDDQVTEKEIEAMLRDDREPVSKKRKTNKEKEDEKKDPKAPLTTFGHSARPRRSVNYASIERGDEAQSQSLVHDFGGSSSSKKRPKRTRDELDANYQEGDENNRKRKTRPGQIPTTQRNYQYLPSGALSNSTQASARALIDFGRTPEDEFARIIPKASDDRADIESRRFVLALESRQAIRRASGGFKRYVMWFSDKQAMALIETVHRRCNLSLIDDDNQRALRALRHAYNAMPEGYRREWEQAAKMDLHASLAFVPGLSMPLSEILVKDATRTRISPKGPGVRSNCCSFTPLLINMQQTIEHYLQYHDTVHFFGCDICHKLYTSRYELAKHECEEFRQYMNEAIYSGKSLTFEVSYMYLSCSQCGLWLPVKATPTPTKGWTYFATAIANHSCKSLVPIVIYFRRPLANEGKNIRMTLEIIPYIDTTLPMSCEECGIDEFTSFAAIEEHFMTKHEPRECKKCQRQFGTEFAFKHHMQSHMSSSAQFANYLTYSATFEPAPGSGRIRHIGAFSEVPVAGGFVASELQMLEAAQTKSNGFVEPFEDTLRKKLYMYRDKKFRKKENRANGGLTEQTFQLEPGESSSEEAYQRRLLEANEMDTSSESESDGNDDEMSNNRHRKKKKSVAMTPEGGRKYRQDLGYDHIDKEKLFDKSEAEREARRLLDIHFNVRTLMPHERLLNPKEALEVMKQAEHVELPPQDCAIADEIAMVLSKPVTLPAANCIDPLKDYVLLNKIFVYCKKCDSVVSRDIQTHSIDCNIPEDELIEVYNGASGPHAGVRCIFPECHIHLCSVVALRFHLSQQHNLEIPIAPVQDTTQGSDRFNENRYDKSLMSIAKHFSQLQFDERSWLTKMTDIDCYMPFSGLLECKLQPRTLPVARQAPPQRMALNGPSALAEESNGLRKPGNLINPKNVGPMLTRIKPYRLPRTSRWYSCVWCDREYESLDSFVDHLVKNHALACQHCGKCYATVNTRRTHKCTATFLDARRPGQSLSGFCTMCNDLIGIETIYGHMLRRHFSHIEYKFETGELMPSVREMAVRQNSQLAKRTQSQKQTTTTTSQQGFLQTRPIEIPDLSNNHEARLKMIKPGTRMIHGVDMKDLHPRQPPPSSVTINPPDPKNVDTRLMCYMCELTFANDRELASHLEDHAEKWAHCPFCTEAVHGHYELQKHLLTKHVIRISGALCCQFCHEKHRYMTSHMLFRCKKIVRCSICGQKSVDALTNRGHMQRTHSLALRRFQCVYCIRVFSSVGEYYEHDCTAGGGMIFSCTCSPNKFFSTPSGYCDHYDSIHIVANKCRICNFENASQEAMVAHRKTHMRVAPGKDKNPHKLWILIRSMFPKPESGYMRFVGGDARPPPSYEDVDRSDTFLMMGDLGPIPIATLNEYQEAPVTIADALAANFEPSRPGPAHRMIAQNPKIHMPSTSTANEVVTLSDDDESMDCVVVVAQDDKSNVRQKSSTPEASNVDREVAVRIEDAGEGYNSSAQPGYVADDDDLEVAADGSPNGQSVVKEIIDENGDDELAVVAEVEHAAGILPSNVAAGREKTFACKQCSQKFYTNSSLLNHQNTSHKQDAGSTICKGTYGIPKDTRIAFLCRNCSIAFEGKENYDEHMKYHGNTCNSCQLCSGIGFNPTALNTHMQQHIQGKVAYSCGTCMFQFSSDLALMDHLSLAHGKSLFYFCKICGLGSTNADTVFTHVARLHPGHPWTLAQRIGACIAELLNYNPRDEKDYATKLLQHMIDAHTPSECTHRNMLLTNEMCVACKTCQCLQSLFAYAANNGYGKDDGKSMPVFQLMQPPNDARKDFPLVRHLDNKNADVMIRMGNVQLKPPVVTPAAPPPHQQNGSVRRPYLEMPSHFQPSNVTIQRGSHPGVQRAPVVSMTNNGGGGARGATYPVQQTASVSVQQRMGDASNIQRRVVLPSSMRIGSTVEMPSLLPQVHQQPLQQHIRNATAVMTQCRFKDCQKSLYSEFDRQIHAMHNVEASWFCRQCGTTKMTELELFQHYIQCHVTPCYEKFVNEGFKSSVFKLTCPIAACKNMEIPSALAFEKHMRKSHQTELPFEADCCETRFASKELCEQHQSGHVDFVANNGTDGPCCPICGTLELWSLGKDIKIDCLQSHLIRHGLDYRSSCRSCLKQFASDTNQLQVIDHIHKEHANSPKPGVVHCRLCKSGFSQQAFVEHCKKFHVFNILCKANLSVRGELVVTAGEEYERYVGLVTGDKRINATPKHDYSHLRKQQQPSTSSSSATATAEVRVGGAELNLAAAIGELTHHSNERNVMDGEITTVD